MLAEATKAVFHGRDLLWPSTQETRARLPDARKKEAIVKEEVCDEDEHGDAVKVRTVRAQRAVERERNNRNESRGISVLQYELKLMTCNLKMY